MLRLPQAEAPPIGLGLLSLVLGTIGLVLFFLPILAIPLGACGLVAAIVGIIAGARRTDELRWSWAGLVIALAALGAGLVLYNAPLGEEPRDPAPRLWQVPASRPYIPPPGRPGS